MDPRVTTEDEDKEEDATMFAAAATSETFLIDVAAKLKNDRAAAMETSFAAPAKAWTVSSLTNDWNPTLPPTATAEDDDDDDDDDPIISFSSENNPPLLLFMLLL